MAWTRTPTLTPFKEKLCLIQKDGKDTKFLETSLRNQWPSGKDTQICVSKQRNAESSLCPLLNQQRVTKTTYFILRKSVKSKQHFPARHQDLRLSSGKSMWEAESNKKLGISAHNSGIQLHRKIHFISCASQARKLAFSFWRSASWIPILVWHQDLNASTKFFQESTWYNTSTTSAAHRDRF